MAPPSLLGRTYAEAGRVGSGAFGAVVRVFDDTTGEELAAKIFSEDDNSDTPGEALREVSFMKLLTTHRAPCCVHLVDLAFELSSFDGLVAIMPLYCRDLAKAIDSNDLRAARLGVMRDVLSAMAYLHSAEPAIVHRDMKPENVLLDAEERAFLTDFSLMRFLSDGPSAPTKKKKKNAVEEAVSGSGALGTACYMAPEVLAEAAPDVAADLWAVGVTFLELCEGARLETERDKAALRIIRKKRDGLSDKPLPSMLRGLLQEDPKDRLRSEDALRGPVFSATSFPEPLRWKAPCEAPDKLVLKACWDARADVPQTSVAAQFYRRAAPLVPLRCVAAVACKMYEHDVRADEELVDDVKALEAAQLDLLRHFNGNLLAPYRS